MAAFEVVAVAADGDPILGFLGEAIKPSNSCVTFLLSFVRRLFEAAESAVGGNV